MNHVKFSGKSRHFLYQHFCQRIINNIYRRSFAWVWTSLNKQKISLLSLFSANCRIGKISFRQNVFRQGVFHETSLFYVYFTQDVTWKTTGFRSRTSFRARLTTWCRHWSHNTDRIRLRTHPTKEWGKGARKRKKYWSWDLLIFLDMKMKFTYDVKTAKIVSETAVTCTKVIKPTVQNRWNHYVISHVK